MRITERHNDAIGTLKAKKLAVRKADSLQCESGPSMDAATAQADMTSGKGYYKSEFLTQQDRGRNREGDRALIQLGQDKGNQCIGGPSWKRTCTHHFLPFAFGIFLLRIQRQHCRSLSACSCTGSRE